MRGPGGGRIGGVRDGSAEPVTLRSLKSSIIDRLRSRFDLEPGPFAAQLKLSPTMGLVTDVSELLKSFEIVQADVTIDGTGNFWPHTVPTGQRWTVYGYHAYDSGSGVYTFTTIDGKDASSTFLCPIGGAFSAIANKSGDITPPRVLEEGDQMGVNIDAKTTNGPLTMRLWIAREDAF